MSATNTTFGFLLFHYLWSKSSTVTDLPYDENPVYNLSTYGNYDVKKDIVDWDGKNAYKISDYDYINAEENRIDIIFNFAQKLIQNSKDIDSEFVEIVNNHFWDLI
jgi:hypothetical protein